MVIGEVVGIKDLIALGGVLVTLLSVMSVAIFAWINYQRERLNQRIQHANLTLQYFAALRPWANELADLLSDAIHFVELDPARCPAGSFFDRRNQFRARLSSMIDRGKWFFPNLHSQEVGAHKEKAYRGYRQAVLNSLVEAYNTLTALDYVSGNNNQTRRDALVAAKRQFVGEIQDVLNPAKQDKEFRDITRRVAGGRAL